MGAVLLVALSAGSTAMARKVYESELRFADLYRLGDGSSVQYAALQSSQVILRWVDAAGKPRWEAALPRFRTYRASEDGRRLLLDWKGQWRIFEPGGKAPLEGVQPAGWQLTDLSVDGRRALWMEVAEIRPNQPLRTTLLVTSVATRDEGQTVKLGPIPGGIVQAALGRDGIVRVQSPTHLESYDSATGQALKRVPLLPEWGESAPVPSATGRIVLRQGQGHVDISLNARDLKEEPIWITASLWPVRRAHPGEESVEGWASEGGGEGRSKREFTLRTSGERWEIPTRVFEQLGQDNSRLAGPLEPNARWGVFFRGGVPHFWNYNQIFRLTDRDTLEPLVDQQIPYLESVLVQPNGPGMVVVVNSPSQLVMIRHGQVVRVALPTEEARSSFASESTIDKSRQESWITGEEAQKNPALSQLGVQWAYQSEDRSVLVAGIKDRSSIVPVLNGRLGANVRFPRSCFSLRATVSGVAQAETAYPWAPVWVLPWAEVSSAKTTTPSTSSADHDQPSKPGAASNSSAVTAP